MNPEPTIRPSNGATGAVEAGVDSLHLLQSERRAWARERESLLAMLAHQQRLAQTGLVTSGLSHDIRNHVQILLSVAEFALLEEDPKAWRDALQSVVGRCEDLVETTQAFLSFARCESAVGSTTFTLSDVLAHCRRLVRRPVGATGVTIECVVRQDGTVRGATRLAVQAVVNLATNALKACAQNGGGSVVVEASRPRPDICRLTVRDDGPGVPEEIRARLFRPFVTGTAATGGTGLGLYVVRQIVRDLGGTIRVKTSPCGTTFRIDLPAEAAAPAATRPVGERDESRPEFVPSGRSTVVIPL